MRPPFSDRTLSLAPPPGPQCSRGRRRAPMSQGQSGPCSSSGCTRTLCANTPLPAALATTCSDRAAGPAALPLLRARHSLWFSWPHRPNEWTCAGRGVRARSTIPFADARMRRDQPRPRHSSVAPDSLFEGAGTPCHISPARTELAPLANERASRPRLGLRGSGAEPTWQAAPTASDEQPSVSLRAPQRATLAPALMGASYPLAVISSQDRASTRL